jgi:hypothetical protein
MLTRPPRFILRAALLLVLVTASPGMAAPFCAITERTTVCTYTDVQACQHAAEQQQGVCTVDPQALRVPVGSTTPFCLLNSTGTYCAFTAWKACELAAIQYKGLCVVNPQRFPQ